MSLAVLSLNTEWLNANCALAEKNDELELIVLRLNMVPAKVWALTNLVSLNVTGNILTNIEGINALRRLQSFFGGFNAFSFFPMQLISLPLTKLDLTGNGIENLPEEIGTLTSLKTLNLSKNLLKNLPSSIGKLKELEDLYLFGNKLESLPSTFENFPNMLFLYLNENRLTAVVLNRFPELRRACLLDNPLTGIKIHDVPKKVVGVDDGVAIEEFIC